MTLVEYCLFAFSSLFVIVDPIAAVPAFLAITARERPAAQLRVARTACAVAGGVLAFFAFGGNWIFRTLGISLAAFQIAGSILLLRIAVDMLHGQRSAAQETSEETEAAAAKDDVAVTPLAVPMLAGPGAISASVMLLHRAEGLPQLVALYACIAVVCGLSYLVFHVAVRTTQWLSPIALKLVARLMGLVLAAIAVQFFIDGLRQTDLFGPRG
jgi:multiple antibiotic resistance protein